MHARTYITQLKFSNYIAIYQCKARFFPDYNIQQYIYLTKNVHIVNNSRYKKKSIHKCGLQIERDTYTSDTLF